MTHSETNADVNASHSSPNSAATASNAAMLSSAATAVIVPLSNTQQVINLKLTNNNYLYWRMQMKPYLIGQGVFSFVDGSNPCPSSHASATATVLAWKQQDQLILSALLSSLSVEVLHLVVDCSTSASVWNTLESALASPSNSRIMQLHGSLQDLRQGDDSKDSLSVISIDIISISISIIQLLNIIPKRIILSRDFYPFSSLSLNCVLQPCTAMKDIFSIRMLPLHY